jgi:steroid delta-isomerase
MVDAAWIRRCMSDYVSKVDAGDIDGILALYADDASVEDPVGSPPRIGRAAIERFYRDGLGQAAARAELTGPVRVAGRCGAMPFRVDLNWQGRACSIQVIDVMEFDEQGLIRSMKAYWGEGDLQWHS